MSAFSDLFQNPNDPQFQEEQKIKAELEEKMRDPRVVKVMWHDYQYKKSQALKYMRLYEKMQVTDSDSYKGTATLLKKAEKWQAKAQAVLDKFKLRNGDSNINNLTNQLDSDL